MIRRVLYGAGAGFTIFETRDVKFDCRMRKLDAEGFQPKMQNTERWVASQHGAGVDMKRRVKLIYWSLYYAPFAVLFGTLFKCIARPYEHFFFVATTGRSGTGTLFEIFKALDEVTAFQEPWPIMHDDLLRAANAGNPHPARQVFRRVKMNMIRWSNLKPARRFYFESNHLFIKSFIDPAAEQLGDRMTVLHLRRDPVSVARSLYALNTIPGVEEGGGNKWYLDYHASGNLIQMAPVLDEELTHPFYKCLWYWYEIEQRVQAARRRYPHVRMEEVNTADLNDPDRVQALLRRLNLSFNSETVRQVAARHHNRKSREKTNRLSLEEAHKMHAIFTAKLDLMLHNDTFPVSYDYT
jgi:hypothetical protein